MSYSEDGLAHTFMPDHERRKYFQKPYHQCLIIFLTIALCNLGWNIALPHVAIELDPWILSLQLAFNLLTTLAFFFTLGAYKECDHKMKIYHYTTKPSIYSIYFVSMVVVAVSLLTVLICFQSTLTISLTWTIVNTFGSLFFLGLNTVIFITSKVN